MKKRQDNIYYEIPASPRIISGETALGVLGEEMRSHGATNVLLITDAVSDKSELADRLRIALTATGLRPGANYVAKRDVASYSAVYELRELYRINVCDGIIACGGEATIGTAKALSMGEVQGAMSSLAIAVAGLITVVFASVFATFY